MPIITSNPNDQKGLVKPTADAQPPTPIQSIRITDPKYKGVAVDTRWISRVNLMTSIDGSPWVIPAYYSQVLNTDSQLSGQQTTLSPISQQYKKIVNLELRVTQPLGDPQQDNDTGTMKSSGAANMFPSIVPNDGDMFAVDIGENQLVVFRVNTSVKKSLYADSAYEIVYSLDYDNPESLADLEEKVVETLYFHRNWAKPGRNPIIVQSVYDSLMELSSVYASLVRQYFKRFTSREHSTLLVPGQESSTYDHFLVEFLLSQNSVGDSPELLHLNRFNVDDDPFMEAWNFWTVLKERDVSYLNSCFKRIGIVKARSFTRNPFMNSMRYSGVANVMYPVDPALPVDHILQSNIKAVDALQLVPGPIGVGQLNQMVMALNLKNTNPDILDNVYPVTVDDYYVLSENFYAKTEDMSTLEALVWKYLERLEIDPITLVDTAKLNTKWGALEQFYYVPILLLLMRSILAGE